MTKNPSVDISFLLLLLKDNPNGLIHINVNSTDGYIIKGRDPIAKRIVLIRAIDGQVDHEFAIGVATRMKRLPDLLKWLEDKKGWKDGAFTERLLAKVPNL
jgi:hypothetical protein